MSKYNVILADGQRFMMSACMEDASAQIEANFHGGDDDSWQGTPYQTADACHCRYRAATLVAEYFRTDDDDCAEVESVERTRTIERR